MKYLTLYFKKDFFSNYWIQVFFNIFFFLIKEKQLFLFRLNKILIFYLKFIYFNKVKKKINFTFFLQKHNKILNLNFFIIQKLKINLFNFFYKTNSTILLQGRGFRLINLNNSFLIFKLGFTHNIILFLNKQLSSQLLTKNAQKFRLSGNLIHIIQILACLNYLKKKNIFTAKGIFFSKERLKKKKSTKLSW